MDDVKKFAPGPVRSRTPQRGLLWRDAGALRVFQISRPASQPVLHADWKL
jgi:hypothetical protein